MSQYVRQSALTQLVLRLSGALLFSASISDIAYADSPPVTSSDWGVAGLLQTPSARMHDAGEASATVSRTAPYTRLSFMLQPFDWLEGGFRYVDVSNRLYGASIAGTQSYKDKSIDVKARFLEESRYLPAMAIGARDIGGTGLFSSEYVVANKKAGDLDFSLGMGWGYLGARGDFSNPFSVISDKFNTRPGVSSASAGSFDTRSYFRGRTALFGGVQYQTPFKPLLIKLEYEGNNYQHEPLGNNQTQDSPLNVGIVYRVSPSIDLQVGWERGNTAMAGISFHSNLARLVGPGKVADPAPVKAVTAPAAGQSTDWKQTAAALTSNAGYAVDKIERRGNELIVTAEQKHYDDPKEAMDRAGRILQNNAPADVKWFTVANETDGLRTVDWSVKRDAFAPVPDDETASLPVFVASAPAKVRSEPLYKASEKPYSGGLSLGYRQSVGGPNEFLLYQFTIDADGVYHFTKDFWASITTSVRILDNYDKFVYDAPSNLPRVRTYIREYLTTSRYTMPNLQLTKTWQPSSNVFAMAYGGMLESMFGGVGGEVLYRPYGSHFALGMDANQVKQRDFAQGLTFRDYSTFTGHVTAYIDTGFQGILARVSVGQYLAKDKGGTLDLSRRFKNGVVMGAYATITNVSKAQFGEGSFDKGIYVLMPFDLLLNRSTRSTASFVWDPLTRDGGARLAKRYDLYSLTADREPSLAK